MSDDGRPRPRPPWLSPEIDPELQRLADLEAAARLAVDGAMTQPTPLVVMVRLREAWHAANDALADAMKARDQSGD